jgi:hypothetical protein
MYTKGKWELKHGQADYSDVRVVMNDKLIAEMGQFKTSWDEQIANAYLIAAAPAMYEALQAALKALESPEARHVIEFTMERELAKSAIKAAEGKGLK